jgi:hypothetical protein
MLSTVQKLVRLKPSQLRNRREFVRLKRNCACLYPAES